MQYSLGAVLVVVRLVNKTVLGWAETMMARHSVAQMTENVVVMVVAHQDLIVVKRQKPTVTEQHLLIVVQMLDVVVGQKNVSRVTRPVVQLTYGR